MIENNRYSIFLPNKSAKYNRIHAWFIIFLMIKSKRESFLHKLGVFGLEDET